MSMNQAREARARAAERERPVCPMIAAVTTTAVPETRPGPSRERFAGDDDPSIRGKSKGRGKSDKGNHTERKGVERKRYKQDKGDGQSQGSGTAN